MRNIAVLLLLLVGLGVMAPAASATSPRTVDFDCKESPTPDMPGQGLEGFFGPEPSQLPPADDPFAEDAKTTVYEQYGFAGLRWHNYDLGCGPDAAANPEAVIGTSVGNWVMNLPIGLASLTASVTQAAFHPTFLGVFDPVLTHVSAALHESLFARWVPAIVALLGVMLLIKARGMALATSAAAIGWALFVVVAATALFRWPVEAGSFADDSVTTTLGSVVDGLDGSKSHDPSTSIASAVQSSILYTAWLGGSLGSAHSATAEKYGPDLFKAQTLSWREAQIVQDDPEAGKQLIEQKKEDFGKIADHIRQEDPAAYEFLTGARSDTRVAYAFLAALATLLSLPFLLVSALMLLGSFLIVRLAVMLFPAFATLGLFPAARGIVIGVGRTVGAALINSLIFGAGAAVTIVVIGVILDPTIGIPGWLTLVLLPLFSGIMWLILKPFRRLTSMAGLRSDPFNEGASLSHGASNARRLTKKVVAGVAAAYTGGAAAGAVASKVADEQTVLAAPDRAEARPDIPSPRTAPPLAPLALEAAPTTADPEQPGPQPQRPHDPSNWTPPHDEIRDDADVVRPTAESVPLPPTEPEWFDGEEVYPIYRPSDEDAHDAA